MHVAVAMFDTDTDVRLVCNKTHDGTKNEDEAVTAEDTRGHIALIFDAKKKREAVDQKTESEDVVATATPILDAKTFVPAVLYVAAAPTAKPPHEDVFDGRILPRGGIRPRQQAITCAAADSPPPGAARWSRVPLPCRGARPEA